MTSIRTALTVMFAVLAVITGLQGAVFYQQLAKAETDVVDVAGQQLPALSAIRDIGSALLRVRSKQFRLVLSEPIQQVIDNNAADLQTDLDELRTARQRYEALNRPAAEREIYSRLSVTLDNCVQLTSTLPALMREGRTEDARALLLRPWLRVLFRLSDAQLQATMEFVQHQAQLRSATSLDALAHAKTVALVSALAAAGLAIVAIAVSYLRFLKPLGSLTRALDQLAAGDIAVDPVLSRRQDEIGAIGRAVEVFRASIIRMRQAETDRLKTQLFVQNVAASTPDGILGFDENGLVTFWNRAAEDLLGLTAEAAMGQHIDTILTRQGSFAPAGAPWWADRSGTTVETEVQPHTGPAIPVELSYSQWQQDGRVMSCAILRDIRSRKRDEAVLNNLAHTDALTGLPNRLVLTARIAAALDKGRRFAVLMLDLDHFKQVNDMFGHQVGDGILRMTAQRLVACVQPSDTVTRIGGDEFILLISGLSDPAQAAALADRMMETLSEPFIVKDRTIHLGASIGIAFGPTHGTDADELMTCADLALYAAKAHGRRGHCLFTPELRGAAVRDSKCRQELPRAVERGEFRLFFQPQVRLSDGALVGAEALIRWQHPELGLVAPDAFISVLESSHLAEEVGDWVIETACRQAAAWLRHWPDFRIGVNLSNAHFRSGRLAKTVTRILADVGLPASALELEITEHIMLRYDERVIAPLHDLQKRGVSIAFDDYGTGYASLSLLKRLPLNRLKIDRSFVRNMDESPEDSAIIRTILALGISLDLKVIAEGIETEDQAERLSLMGCGEGQGYLYGKPIPAEDFVARFAPTAPQVARFG